MSSTATVKPGKDEKVYRMSNDQLVDKSNPGNDPLPNTSGNVVNFKVEYPKDFKGEKFMKEGSTHKLHILHAECLEKKGLGKISKIEK
jgi:hypothetical protein